MGEETLSRTPHDEEAGSEVTPEAVAAGEALSLVQDAAVAAQLISSLDEGSAQQSFTYAAEDTLRQSAQLVATAAAGLGTWSWSLADGRVHWDEHAACIFGEYPQYLTTDADTLLQSIHPEDAERAAAAARGCVSEGIPIDVQFRIVRPDGKVRKVLVRGNCVRGADGKVSRLAGAVLDITGIESSAQTLETTTRAQTTTVKRLAGVAAAATAIAGASSIEELAEIVVRHGTGVLGADAGGLCVRDERSDVVRVTFSGNMGEEVQDTFREIPLEAACPLAVAARTGQAVVLPTREECLSYCPEMALVQELTKRPAWAALPLRAQGELLGSLLVGWAEEQSFTLEQLGVLHTFAEQCALTLHRIQVQEAERAVSKAEHTLSELLQRSCLTTPPDIPGAEVAVRYRPTVKGVHIGGDWYDVLLAPDLSVVLAIGDCTGHDQASAVTMMNLRSLLRSAAYNIKYPGLVLSALEDTMEGLGVEALATAVLARVEEVEGSPGERRLHWSNAGHPPPVMAVPGGLTSILASPPDVLLGVPQGVSRSNYTASFPARSILVLYTDGLVERRDEDLDVGLERLRTIVEVHQHLHAEDLCDVILEQMIGDHSTEDDVALLVLR